VAVAGFGSIFTDGGDVTIEGQGGGSETSRFNRGVELSFGDVRAGGLGKVTIHGTGGASAGDGNHGVWVASISEITSAGGDIRVTGQGGGSGGSGSNYGLLIQSQIRVDGTGDLFLQGTGGAGSGDDNIGVVSAAFSTGGSVQVTGIEGAGPSGTAIVVEKGTILAGASGGSLTLIGNSMNIASAATITAGESGTVTLKPLTSGVGIHRGLATDPIGGPLGLTSDELARIAAGTLQLGDASTGPITIEGLFTLAGRNVVLKTAAGVSGDGHIVNGSASAVTVTIDQAGDATFHGRLGGTLTNPPGEDQNLAFSKLGSGTLTLSRSFHGYSGHTTITQGTLRLTAADILPFGVRKGDVFFNPPSGTATLDIGSTQNINGLWSSGAGASIIDNAVGGTTTLAVGNNNTSSTFGGVIQNTGGSLILTSVGTLTLTGANTNDRIDIHQIGTVLVNGSARDVRVNGGKLGGNGTVASVNVSHGLPPLGRLAPGVDGPGILSTGNVTFGGSAFFDVDLIGPTLGTQFDQLHVTGTVSLAETSLHLAVGYSPATGQRFTIINNDLADPVSGTFQNLAEGQVFTVTTGAFASTFQITYQGGDGNDVVLTTLRQWHNAALPEDVSGDGNIVAGDALEIINFINAFGAGPVPLSAAPEPPFYDVTGDNFIAPDDALAVINYINAFGPTIPTEPPPEGEPESPSSANSDATNADSDLAWLTLLAEDLASHTKRKPR
jgi:autotransporter-associated beta strand protein